MFGNIKYNRFFTIFIASSMATLGLVCLFSEVYLIGSIYMIGASVMTYAAVQTFSSNFKKSRFFDTLMTWWATFGFLGAATGSAISIIISVIFGLIMGFAAIVAREEE